MSADNSRGLLPLLVFAVLATVFYYKKILAYLNEKCNSNRYLFVPSQEVLRYAHATLRTGCGIETNAPSILALATLGN